MANSYFFSATERDLSVPLIPERIRPAPPNQALMTPPAMQNRPASSADSFLADAEWHYRQLGLAFIAAATGTAPGHAIDENRICAYLSQPSPSTSASADCRWRPDADSDSALDAWAAQIAAACESALKDGPVAYVDALMRTIFPQASPELPNLPVSIYRTWMAIDRLALDVALAANVDFGALDKFCYRMQRQFLFNAFLLPRLQPDLARFAEPRPTAAQLRAMLVSAFNLHAANVLDALTLHTERSLALSQRARLRHLRNERDVMLALGEDGARLDNLGGLQAEFVDDAADVLQERIDEPAYAVQCLLEVYASYPHQVHDDYLRLSEAAATADSTALLAKRAEFQIQHNAWKKDLEFLAHHRSGIDQLGEHGKQYFLRTLKALSLAAYRSRQQRSRLSSALSSARLQPEVIAEEDEPVQ